MEKEEYSKVIAFCQRDQKPIFDESMLKVHKRDCERAGNKIIMRDESDNTWQRIKKEVFKIE